MEKTKLGISVGLLGAALFFSCLFGGYTISIVLAGYILLFEENVWLKRSAIKGIALMFWFAFLSAVIHFIPNAITLFDSMLAVVGGHFNIGIVNNMINIVNNALSIIEKLLFIILGCKALRQRTVKISVIDSLVNKHMD